MFVVADTKTIPAVAVTRTIQMKTIAAPRMRSAISLIMLHLSTGKMIDRLQSATHLNR
jgi:hypothetical protein